MANLRDLHDRVHSGRYRARPSRRAYIPKADGRLRPLGIASLEDKIVQRAVVEVLNAVYEADFRGFSYGFRPGRRPHDALDALAVGIYRKKVNWVLDADIRDFFGQLDRDWLRRFLRHRIADKRVLRLIGKWLAAGVIEDGEWTESEQGSPQGASVSPLLANVYLHYVLDLWADWWRKRHARGDVIIVRFADDFIVGFEYREDAERFLDELARQVREVRAGAAPGQDPADRVRAACRPGPGGPGSGQAGDVRLPGLHAHLREVQERAVLGEADHDLETDAGQAESGQRPAQAAHASAHTGAGPLAGQRGARAHGLLRRARQLRGGGGLPRPGDPALAEGAAAPQPENPGQLDADGPDPETMATAGPRDASLPGGALRRHTPKVGAQCGNPARWDLRGGPPARAVPTATSARRRWS